MCAPPSSEQCSNYNVPVFVAHVSSEQVNCNEDGAVVKIVNTIRPEKPYGLWL